MNTQTKKALRDFASQVQALASGTVNILGVQTATEIMIAADNLKQALDKDETIVEVS